MKKRVQTGMIGAYIMLILVGVIWHAGGVSAEDTIKLRVNSHTTSTEVMSNMQPGDATVSDYTIINEGHESFNYFVDFKFTSGDPELYDLLETTLQKEGVILYSGVMSKAEGRVAVGTLAGGAQEAIRMDVSFPIDAGNEFQGKTTSVDFIFSASASPDPSASPSASPTASASQVPSASPSATPTASASPDPSASAGATPTASASPDSSASPGATPTATSGAAASPTATPTAGASAAPTVSASPGTEEVTVTDEPLPLGGVDNGTPGSSVTPAPAPTPSPDDEVVIGDDELPLSGPEKGNELPDTAEPWYNLILISLGVAIVSLMVLRRLNSKK